MILFQCLCDCRYRLVIRQTGKLGPETQIFAGAKIGFQCIRMAKIEQASTMPIGIWPHDPTVPEEFASRRPYQSSHHAQQAGLAGTIGTCEYQRLAGGDTEIEQIE